MYENFNTKLKQMQYTGQIACYNMGEIKTKELEPIMQKFLVDGWTYDRDEKPVSNVYPLIAKEFSSLKAAQKYHEELVQMHKDGRFMTILGDDIYYVCIDINYICTIDEKSVRL